MLSRMSNGNGFGFGGAFGGAMDPPCASTAK